MILVDTSIWVDHLRTGVPAFARRLERSEVLVHPFVVGELALGRIKGRQTFLGLLQRLPVALLATHREALHLIETVPLFGRGPGYVDAHLLASTRLTPDARLWTHDRRLMQAAAELGVAADPG